MASQSPVPVSGVCELVLEQSDLAAAEEFYAGDLGFPVVECWADEAVWVMAGDRTRIGLWRPQIGLGGGRGGVHVHYAIGAARRGIRGGGRAASKSRPYIARPRPFPVRPRTRSRGLRNRPRRPCRRVLDLGRGRSLARAGR